VEICLGLGSTKQFNQDIHHCGFNRFSDPSPEIDQMLVSLDIIDSDGLGQSCGTKLLMFLGGWH
jgi:hypothetical protein